MKIYHVKENYIKYLRQFDNRVLENKNEKRPYVGVVISVNGLNYYIPLSSPKPKHLKMKNGKDFHKIKNGEYGAINFNLMIPIKNSELLEYNYSKESDVKYKELLTHQYSELLNMKDTIINKANKLYNLYHSDNLTNADIKIKERCCNFDLLEVKCKEYKGL